MKAIFQLVGCALPPAVDVVEVERGAVVEDLGRERPRDHVTADDDLHAQRQGWLKRIVGVKYFNVFGPNEDHKEDMRSVVHKAYHQILETGSVKLFKSSM